jgi:uncharacterized repeat protein (TIGR03803 family)
MRNRFRRLALWGAHVLVRCIPLIVTAQLFGQTFTTIHSFTATTSGTNTDGSQPTAALVVLGNTLYGTAHSGGSSGNGTVFAINTDGTGFTTLHNFSPLSPFSSDGGQPGSDLALSGPTMYGTTTFGGIGGDGTVFAVNTNGTGFITLHNFTGPNDGALPKCILTISGSILYGTAALEGSGDGGTVFAMNTDGTGFHTLHSFTIRFGNPGTNTDGASPGDGLVLSGDTLYGTAVTGGSYGNGTVFALKTNGTGFTTLHNFKTSDGVHPYAGVTLSGKTLYGTTHDGGDSGTGSIFGMNIDGTGYRVLHSFEPLPAPYYTNSDGANPYSRMILTGRTLYGVAYNGGSGFGTVYQLNTDGTGFKILHDFPGEDGESPYSRLLLSGNNLYGTTEFSLLNGSSVGSGTVFIISLPPQLTITETGASVILNWPTNLTGYTLQSTTNLASPVWTTNSTAPVVVNGQYTVSNPIAGAQQFFRLSQ